MEITSKEKVEIKNIFTRLTDAWEASNLSSFANEFTEDAIFTVWFGLTFNGKQEIIYGHEPVFKNNYLKTSYKMTISNLKKIGDSVIIANLRGNVIKIGSSLPKEPDTVPIAIMEKLRDEWKITAFQNTPYAVNEFITNPDIRELRKLAKLNIKTISDNIV